MRVATNSMYSKFIYDQQNTYARLNKVTNQLSSGLKIDKIYDNPTIFTNTLRLDNEQNSLTQVVNTSKNAQTFANNSDTTMSDMVKTLETFKTKLLQAANASNNDTNYSAIADELQGLRNHLEILSNTSINGKFLFSGTAFDTKPISDNGDYNGNDKRIKAKIGNDVEVPYNIDGASLFEGIDRNYSKHISTNIKHFNALKENPKFVVEQDGKKYIDKEIKAHGKEPASDAAATQESLSTDSEIRMLTGVDDKYDAATDTYSDGTSYFYLTGRKPDGETFNEKIALSNGAKISDLIQRIGQAFGNTATTKAVDVSMNQDGQFEIKDTTTGKMLTDFNMIASNADETSIDDVVKNGDYAVSFIKSKFPPIRDIATPTAQNRDFDNRIFTLNSEFRTIDTESYAKPTDTIYNVLGQKGLDKTDNNRKDIDHIKLTGTDTDGNAVNDSLTIDSSTTMKDLTDKIKNDYGDVDVSLENGKIIIKDNTLKDKNDTSKLSLTMDAQDSNNDSLSMFGRVDGITNDKTGFKVDGRLVSSNVAQVDKKTQTYATEKTELIDVSGSDDIDGKKIDINYTDKDGNIKRAYVTLRDTADSDGHLSTFTTVADDGTETTYDIFDNEGNKTPIHDKTTTTQEIDPVTCKLCTKTHTTKGISYKQLDDVIGMLTSNNLPANNDYTDYKNAVASSKQDVAVGLKDGKITLTDKNNATTKIKLEMHDNDTDNYDGSKNPVFTFNSNDALTIDKPKVDIFHQLDEMIQSVREGRTRMDGNDDNPRDIGIQAGIELIDHIHDHVIKKQTEIGAISNSLQRIEERNNTLVVHVETLKSDVIDTDVAQASLELQKMTLNYNAMLSTIAKVNNLSLVNYMK